MASSIEQLGNGVGYIYVTDPGNAIVSTMDNDAAGASAALALALTSGPLSGESLASATVTISAVTGSKQVSNITINGVSIMNATVTGATAALLNAAVVANINSFISSPDYNAFVSNSQIIIQPSIGTGATPNGYVIVVSQSGVTYTATNMAGGATTSGTYGTGFNGKRFYLYADVAAAVGNISGATEISASIIQRGSLAGHVTQSGTAATGIMTYLIRQASYMDVTLDSVNGDPAETLTQISTSGFVDGDIIQIRGADPTHVITLTSGTGTNDILLSSGVAFSTADINTSISLQFVAASNQWAEINRTPALSFATASVRGQGVPWAVPGVHAVTMSTGGTVTLTPGTDKGVQNITGSPSMASGYNITTAGSPMDGDMFTVIYKATPTLNSQTVTIFGVALTATQAASGKIVVTAVYSTTATAYLVNVYNNVNNVDWATVASVAAKENSLGNPAANGYMLISNTDGTRYWIPIPTAMSGNNVLSAPNHSDVGTDANTNEKTLKTYTLPANTFLPDQSQIVIEARGYVGADGNTKTINVYFGSQVVGSWVTTVNNNQFKLICTVTRNSVTTQFGDAQIIASGGTCASFANTSLTQDLSTDITLSITGQNGTAIADDVVCSYMSVKLFTY